MAGFACASTIVRSTGFFRDLLDRCVIVYLDDILIFTKTREQHLRDLDAVFKRLQENRLITKGSKCEFLKQELEFLGHVVSRDGIKIDPANIKTIQEWKSLTNITELQSFLGFVNYVRRFIPNMAGITADLIPPSSRRGARVPGDAEPAFPATRSAPSQVTWLQPPRAQRERILRGARCSTRPCGSLQRIAQKLLHRHYYWPDSSNNVQQYVSSCRVCQAMKSTRQRPAGLLQPLEPPERPWQQVTMDFFMGMPAEPFGNNAVLVVVDCLTKMAHFAPCRTTITAKETAHLFISTVVRLHGIPLAIISDRDPKFTSKFWKETWAQYGTKLQFSSAYHPQTDGQTERTNQTMEQLIRTNCSDPARWEDSLAMLEFAFNNALSSTNNHSPLFFNYGMDPMVPTMTTLDNPVPRSQTFNLRLPGPSNLRPRFCGPFKIIKMVTSVTAKLLLPDDWRIHDAFHVSLLRKFMQAMTDIAWQ
ncbi:unnamed protein product [Closterium sp. NIES-54]